MVAFLPRGNPLLIQARLAQPGPDMPLCVQQWNLLPYLHMLQSRKGRWLIHVRSLQPFLRDNTLLRQRPLNLSRDETRLPHRPQDLHLHWTPKHSCRVQQDTNPCQTLQTDLHRLVPSSHQWWISFVCFQVTKKQVQFEWTKGKMFDFWFFCRNSNKWKACWWPLTPCKEEKLLWLHLLDRKGQTGESSAGHFEFQWFQILYWLLFFLFFFASFRS